MVPTGAGGMATATSSGSWYAGGGEEIGPDAFAFALARTWYTRLHGNWAGTWKVTDVPDWSALSGESVASHPSGAGCELSGTMTASTREIPFGWLTCPVRVCWASRYAS